MSIFICGICYKEFTRERSLHSHKLVHNSKVDIKKAKLYADIAIKEKQKAYTNNPKFCEYCNVTLTYKQRKSRFCSHTCSATYNHNLKPKKPKKSRSIKNLYCEITFHVCNITGLIYCSRNGDGKIRRKSPYTTTKKEKYYNDCKFKFNVYNYPKWFDLHLLENHGWYTCPGIKRKNEPKNITGISRDHIFPISLAFNIGIDPKIISHPANCNLITQLQNVSKGSKKIITINELMDNIFIFDILYKKAELESRTPLIKHGLETHCTPLVL